MLHVPLQAEKAMFWNLSSLWGKGITNTKF